MSLKEIGEVKRVSYEIKQIEWRLADIFSLLHHRYYLMFDSPSFFFPDVDVDVIWHLRMWPNTQYNENRILMLVYSNEERKYSVEYNFGLKKYDGSVEQFAKGILDPTATSTDNWAYIMEIKDLRRRQSELARGNVLTVICTIKFLTEIAAAAVPTASDKMKSSKMLRLDILSENFKDLFTDRETCDVTLKVKEKEYKAHKSVLIARSSVLAAFFKHDSLERQTGVITIPDCDPDSFQEFLEYLYCGKLEELSFRSALNLYYTSDKYNVEELKAFCVEYLMKGITVENMCEVAVFANQYDETELFSAVQDFFNKNVTKVLVNPEWECLLKKDHRLANKLMVEMSKVKL